MKYHLVQNLLLTGIRIQIKESAIESKQLQIEVDEPEEDQMAILMGSEADDDNPAEEISEENLLRALMEAQEKK